VSLAVERIIGSRENDEALGQFMLMLRTRGHRSQPLLNAVERAPRTEFVAPEHIGFAYQDLSLPIPCGQETGRPLSIIEVVTALRLEPSHHVLEIGAGSGWQTALIAGLAGAVASVERWATLTEDADARLHALGFTNAVVAHGDGEGGLPAAAPFDRIVFNVAVEDVSDLVLSQLAEGGMIIAPIQGRSRQVLTRLVRTGGSIASEEIASWSAPILAQGCAENL
jgi:protein-L-isoaspartate(D-aspartate) O-methyltransferase